MKPGKTCSSLKGRKIRITRKGKLMAAVGYKRHRMLHRGSRMLRQFGMKSRSKHETTLVKKILGM